jgi:ribosomal protein S18 acetylase RimI-like enzyme
MAEDVLIQPITAQSLPEVHAGLVELLRETVNGGDTVGFLPPISTEEAAAFWAGVREALEGGGRRLLVARQAGRVVGTVQLDLATQTNGRHRAEVMKLLVHREARRQGLGRRLMEAVEGVARDEGRTLLVLDTRQGEPSAEFYAALGYRRAGVIPNFAESADGTLHATVLFYKEL